MPEQWKITEGKLVCSVKYLQHLNWEQKKKEQIKLTFPILQEVTYLEVGRTVLMIPLQLFPFESSVSRACYHSPDCLI